jgi:hypothetical protein
MARARSPIRPCASRRSARPALTFLGERFRQLQPAVERNLHPMLWDPVLVHLLQVPTAAAGLLLGFLLLWLGAAPKSVIGIVTRR